MLPLSDTLEHIGVARRSGRYPWGSGSDPFQSSDSIRTAVAEMRKQGLKDSEIAKKLGMTTTKMRSEISWEKEEELLYLKASIESRKQRGESDNAIAEALNISPSAVRYHLNQQDNVKTQQLHNIKNVLETSVDKDLYLDVGIGVERQMGISREKLNAVVDKMTEEGYYVHTIYVKRIDDPSKWTTMKVLSKEPDMEVVSKNRDLIRSVEYHTEDGGLTGNLGLKPIKMVSWDKVDIRYAEEGGSDKDGLMEIRMGADGFDLGGSHYAQVRIGVGENSYLKGMAMYGDNLPDGKDIVFYTNKPKGTPPKDVLKEMKNNPDNPFGTTIKPGGQRGYLNIVNEEGDWYKWNAGLPSQFLSKQPLKLVDERMTATYKSLVDEFNEINSLTNPLVKRHLMEAYADGLDAKARHLQAQGLPRTKGHVILPYPEMSANEIYAPNYNNGERVVLIRYPHGGRFEIPELTVNNNGPAKKSLGKALDGVGIHPSVASRLSGADFDGDTVYVIPNNDKQIKTSRSLAGLKNFDPVAKYKVDYETMSKRTKQTQMGLASNLITDMTIKGASNAELARAVRHSMVVIDAQKHKLNYKQSAVDNNISELVTKYQSSTNPLTGKKSKGAASTIISRAGKDVEVSWDVVEVLNEKTGRTNKRKINIEKAPLLDTIYKRDGKVDALSSGTAVEKVYVDYANKVKALSNTAHKEVKRIPNIKRDPKMAVKYKEEVASLNEKLNTALLNAPKERRAQVKASTIYYDTLNKLDYKAEKDERKKIKSQATAAARVQVGIKKEDRNIKITDREWDAIQKGAISNEALENILKNTDTKRVKELATPRPTTKMSSAKSTRAKLLLDKGYTQAEVAKDLGISVSTLVKTLSEEE